MFNPFVVSILWTFGLVFVPFTAAKLATLVHGVDDGDSRLIAGMTTGMYLVGTLMAFYLK